MGPNRECCFDCVFWQHSNAGDGECHRYPPPPNSTGDYAARPKTTKDGWCGEFKSGFKPEEK